jgi:hypothetical protein
MGLALKMEERTMSKRIRQAVEAQEGKGVDFALESLKHCSFSSLLIVDSVWTSDLQNWEIAH